MDLGVWLRSLGLEKYEAVPTSRHIAVIRRKSAIARDSSHRDHATIRFDRTQTGSRGTAIPHGMT
jgi:hypothetical protein